MDLIEYGRDQRVGRGGMAAKVCREAWMPMSVAGDQRRQAAALFALSREMRASTRGVRG